MNPTAQLDDGRTDVVIVGVGLVGLAEAVEVEARYQCVADRETVSASARTDMAIV
jgi:hypothetical protein